MLMWDGLSIVVIVMVVAMASLMLLIVFFLLLSELLVIFLTLFAMFGLLAFRMLMLRMAILHGVDIAAGMVAVMAPAIAVC